MRTDFSARENYRQALAKAALAKVLVMDDLKANRLARLLFLLHTRFDGSPGALAKAIRKSATQVSQWFSGNRSISETTARSIEAALGLPKYWMDDPMPHEGAGDQPVILPAPTMSPLVTWETLEVIDLPNQFSVLMPDDAMAPLLAKGIQAQFQRDQVAAPGDVVMAKTPHGMVVRELRQRADGGQALHALHRAYEPLPLAEGVEVVAVFTHAQMTAKALRALTQ